jgi:uncharacterized membrane protein YoaK (UPF0700 family)
LTSGPPRAAFGAIGSPKTERGNAGDLRVRHVLVVGLAVLSGATDAIAFARLGHVFTSVMTGNLVLLGLGVGQRSGGLVVRAVVAIVAYVAGVLAGSRLAGRHREADAPWPAAVTGALVIEWLLFGGFAALWWTQGSHPGGSAQDVLLALAACALGIQASAVLRLGMPGVSTTYLTGTLTTVVNAMAHRHFSRHEARAVVVLSGLVLGAALGGLLALEVPVGAPALQLGVLGGVIVVARIVFWRRTGGNPKRRSVPPAA